MGGGVKWTGDGGGKVKSLELGDGQMNGGGGGGVQLDYRRQKTYNSMWNVTFCDTYVATKLQLKQFFVFDFLNLTFYF